MSLYLVRTGLTNPERNGMRVRFFFTMVGDRFAGLQGTAVSRGDGCSKENVKVTRGGQFWRKKGLSIRKARAGSIRAASAIVVRVLVLVLRQRSKRLWRNLTPISKGSRRNVTLRGSVPDIVRRHRGMARLHRLLPEKLGLPVVVVSVLPMEMGLLVVVVSMLTVQVRLLLVGKCPVMMGFLGDGNRFCVTVHQIASIWQGYWVIRFHRFTVSPIAAWNMLFGEDDSHFLHDCVCSYTARQMRPIVSRASLVGTSRDRTERMMAR